jgi:alkyl hydroperoxide reductase subunit AhpF
MAVLDARVRGQAQKVLAGMAQPVRLVLFTQGEDAIECGTCADTHTLVEEVAGLSEKLTLEVHDFKAEGKLAETLGIDKIPALAVVGAKDHGIRYYGLPSGYEFGSLLQDIVQVSTVDSGLAPASRRVLARLKGPIHLQVFVTPT